MFKSTAIFLPKHYSPNANSIIAAARVFAGCSPCINSSNVNNNNVIAQSQMSKGYCDRPKPKDRQCLNEVRLMGRVGKDPSFNDKRENSPVYFSLATNRFWKSPAGELQDKTDWHQILVLYPGMKSYVLQNIQAGDKVLVLGSGSSNQYSDALGNNKAFYVIRADKIMLLKKKVGGYVEQSDDIESEQSDFLHSESDEVLDEKIPEHERI